MNRLHFVANYLINPTNPVTVNLIGAGGTGCKVLTGLSRINHALIELGHPGLFVTAWDDDTVSEANLGRQLFADAEVGLNKAVALINRTNRFFGTDWKAHTHRYSATTMAKSRYGQANLIITCVDTVSARKEVASALSRSWSSQHGPERTYYWLDFGNSQHSGQVVLATVGKHEQPESEKYETVSELAFVTDEYGDELDAAVEDTTPSCSLAEALTRQDLFINPVLAEMGCALLWRLFRHGMTDYRGFFLNLSNLRTQPIHV